MTIKRSQIVQTAKSYLGVPWTHQGRSRAGVDCVGLVVAVAGDLGILPPDLVIPPYRTRPDASLLSYFDTHMTPVSLRAIKDGTVVIFAYGGSPYHAGIVVNVNSSAIVHAYAAHRKVVPDHLEASTKGRTLIRAYDYPGVTDG